MWLDCAAMRGPQACVLRSGLVGIRQQQRDRFGEAAPEGEHDLGAEDPARAFCDEIDVAVREATGAVQRLAAVPEARLW
jgi:hypothetical protein